MIFAAGIVKKDGKLMTQGQFDSSGGAAKTVSAHLVDGGGPGLYDVNFTPPFTTIFGATVTQVEPSAGSTLDNAVIVELGLSPEKTFSFIRVLTGKDTGAHQDRAFSFIVVGV